VNVWSATGVVAATIISTLLTTTNVLAGSVGISTDISYPTQWSQPQVLPNGRIVPPVPTQFGTRSVGVAFQQGVGAAGASSVQPVSTNLPGLLAAADRGDTNTIKVLLAKHVNVNTPNQFGATALMVAATRGYLGATQLLLENGADINAVTREGRTALIYAVIKGQAKVVQLLLEKKADPKVIDESGKMAVNYAEAVTNSDILALFKGPSAK